MCHTLCSQKLSLWDPVGRVKKELAAAKSMEGEYDEWFLMAGNRGMDPRFLNVHLWSLYSSLPVWHIIIYHISHIILSANGIHSDSAENLAYSDDGKHGIRLTCPRYVLLLANDGWSNGQVSQKMLQRSLESWGVQESIWPSLGGDSIDRSWVFFQ